MGTEANFSCMIANKMCYFRQLEYFCGHFCTQAIHVRCPTLIVVNYYSQHSLVLYLFSGDDLYGQRVEIRHYILPILSSGYENEFCSVWM